MRYLLLIILLTGIVSCGKKTQIKITAKNAATGQGYAGLGFRLKEVKPYTTSTGEVQKTVYEGTFNAQGEAVFEYRLKNRSYIITTLVPEEELCYINDTQYFLHRDDDNLKFDFRFVPCAYLKFRYQNITCQGPNDHIKVHRYTNLEGYVGFITDAEYDGCTDYTMPNFVDVPMGWWFFEWEVTKNSNTEYFSDSIYLSENEYKEYTFQY